MPEKNIMTIHVGPTGRKVFTDNLEMNQNSSNNVLELFCEGKYEFVQVFYTFPDGKTTYKHHMIPDGFDKDKSAYKFHDNIDKAVTSFVIPNVTANLKVSFIGYYKNDLNQYTPVGINDFLITVIRVNNNEVYDQTYNGSDVVNIWKNINNLNALLVDLNPNYKPTTLEDLKAKVDENYNELNTRFDSVPNIEDVYNKEEINQMYGIVYKYGGSVDNFSDLPTDLTNEQTGVVINVRNPNGMNYVWTGSEWDALGGFDETKYYKKDYIDEVIRATQLKAQDETTAVDNKVNNLAATHSSDTSGLRNDITQINAKFADYYNKSDIDGKVSGVFKFMGSKATLEDLPQTGNIVGDVWNVVADNNNNYVWTSDNNWESLGPIVNLSNFYTKDIIDQKLSGLVTADSVYTKAQSYNRTEIDDKIKDVKQTVSLNQTSLSNLTNRLDTHTADFTDFKTSTNTTLERIEREYKAADETLNAAISNKQDTLVSGTNIKTINGVSILGTGNIAISGGSGIDDSTISASSTYSSSKIDSTYLKAPEGRLDIENGRVNLKNNPNSVYSITNNEVVMELNDDGLRYHDNATNRDVNITPYYGAIDQNVDPATIKVNGIGLARETDLNKKVSLRGDTMTGNLNAPAFTVDSTKVAAGDKPLIDGAINFKYKNTNDEAQNAWLTMLPSGQLQFGSQGAVASEIGTVATQEWVNKKITNAYIYKGSVDTYDALPSGADPGFVYNVRSNGANYAWTGTEWDELGATVNLDAYALKTDLNGKQDILVSGINIKTINGESILGTGDITISGGTENAIPLTGSSSLSGNFSPSDDTGASLGNFNKRFDYIYVNSLGSLLKSIDNAYINNISLKTNIKPTNKGSVYLGTKEQWFRGLYLGTPDSTSAGQLLPPGTMTSGKTWQLPNTDGTIALKSDIPHNYIQSDTPSAQTIHSPLEIRGTLKVDVAANNTSHLKLRNTTDGNYVNVTVEEKSGINNTSYNLTLPLKTGTLATLDDISSSGSSGSGIQIYEQMPAPEEVTDGQIIAMPTTDAVVDVVYNANSTSYSSGTKIDSGITKTYNSTIGAKYFWIISYVYYSNGPATIIVPCTGKDFYVTMRSSETNSPYLRCNASTDGKSITLYSGNTSVNIHAVMAF